MNLYIFPEAASTQDGYGIAVDYAYKKLMPNENDIVIWYTKRNYIPYIKNNDIVINKNKLTIIKRIFNVIRGYPSTELSIKDLSFLNGYKFEKIHCDEILFFRSLRKIFPQQHINVRLHNCYSRIYERQKLMRTKIDWKFKLILRLCRNSERFIFNDRNCTKIFLTEEDRNYYTSMYGTCSDSLVWLFNPIIAKNNGIKHINSKTLVWFGGVDIHKKSSIDWFIKSIYIPLKNEIPDLKFYLWGRNTEKFDNPTIDIKGYGFFNGDGFPMNNALYINPEIIGGGIKLKLLAYIEAGIPFITTPFGFEGYSKNLLDSNSFFIEEMDNWQKKIKDIFLYETI